MDGPYCGDCIPKRVTQTELYEAKINICDEAMEKTLEDWGEKFAPSLIHIALNFPEDCCGWCGSKLREYHTNDCRRPRDVY